MSAAESEALFRKLTEEAAASGYRLNPDHDFVLDLMDGLVTNRQRYGYLSCPCRLADGTREKDLDIICPCDYRDADLEEHGACYCALYVSGEVAEGKRPLEPVPERRGLAMERHATQFGNRSEPPANDALPVWRCRVCGYLCARPEPPLKCPICKADQDRFARF